MILCVLRVDGLTVRFIFLPWRQKRGVLIPEHIDLFIMEVYDH